jgi:hypothetical protein
VTHWLTLVLVPGDEPDPAARATELMKHYWIVDLADRYDGVKPWAKCDGFVIGGQYDGVIWGKAQHYNLKPHEYQARYGFDVVKDEDNIRPVSALAPVEVMGVGAIITPDGAWQEWTRDNDATWDDITREVLAEHATCIAVAFDCHS